MGGLMLEGTPGPFWHFASCGPPLKDLGFTASSQEWDKSKECILSLQETAHYSLGLREFHTSRSYRVLGSTLTQPRGEINTPAGPRKCVRVCACVRSGIRASMCTRVCVHTAVFLQWHIFPYPFSLEKLVDPSIVLISWKCPPSEIGCFDLQPMCHFLSNAFHTSSIAHFILLFLYYRLSILFSSIYN